MVRQFILGSALLFSAATPVFAEVSSADRAACTPDVWRLCASEIPDVPGIIACLKRSKAQLSPGCRVVMDVADKKVTAAATRSMRPQPAWCVFGADRPASDEDWRTWCATAP